MLQTVVVFLILAHPDAGPPDANVDVTPVNSTQCDFQPNEVDTINVSAKKAQPTKCGPKCKRCERIRQLRWEDRQSAVARLACCRIWQPGLTIRNGGFIGPVCTPKPRCNRQWKGRR